MNTTCKSVNNVLWLLKLGSLNNFSYYCWLLQEASSQARYLQARLIPSHKDPPYEQVCNLSLWTKLSTF